MTLQSVENEAAAATSSGVPVACVTLYESEDHGKSCSSSSEAQPSLREPSSPSALCFVAEGVRREICRHVLRGKLAKRRHAVLTQVFDATYLNDVIFPQVLSQFEPQNVTYNGGIAGTKDWKISCYLEVMEGGVPTASPHLGLLRVFQPLLDQCNDLFLYWYRQQHACNSVRSKRLGVTAKAEVKRCRRLMTFLTRYTPAPGEQALLKVSLLGDNVALTHVRTRSIRYSRFVVCSLNVFII